MAISVQSNLDFGSLRLIVNLDATETRQGVAEIATQAEVDAGADDTRIVTPLKLRARLSASVAAPLNATGSGTTALTGVAVVLLSGMFTVPALGTGSFEVYASTEAGLGTTLLGTNTAITDLRVNGVTITNARRRKQITATLAVAIALDSTHHANQAIQTGFAPGSYLIELLGSGSGVSTRNVNGERTLSAIQV